MNGFKFSKFTEKFISILLAILVIIFILLPFVSVFKESFFVNGKFSLEYYRDILSNRKLIVNTFKTGFYATFFATFAAVIVACYYFLANKKIKNIITIILSITLISPPFVSSLSYITLFGRRGFITYKLLGLSVNPYGMWGIVFMQTLSDLSLNALILIGALKTLDRNVINSALSLGANTNRIILDVIIPAMKNQIIAVVLLELFRSISDFGTPAIIGGNFSVLSLESYFEIIANGNLSKAAAMNVIILVPALVVYLFLSGSLKSGITIDSFSKTEEVEIKRNGILYYLISVFAIFSILLITSIYLSILLNAFTKMKLGKLTFTFENFRTTNMFAKSIIWRSISYSLISAFGGTLIGLLIAYYLIIKKSRMMKFVDMVSNLPYIIPGTFFGLGYLLFFRSPPIAITGTAAIVVLNVLFKQLPFSTRALNAQMTDIDKNVLNSIKDLGGGFKDEIVDGIIPMTKNAIMISLINAFTKTMTTVGTIIFLVYPGRKLMTLVMFDVIQSGKYGEGSVLAFYIILICLAFNILLRFFMNRDFRKRRHSVFRS